MDLKHYKDIYPKDIPEVLHDNITKRSYRRLSLLGRGGFGQCFEIHDVSSDAAYALKVLSKNLIAKKNLAENIEIEVGIHRQLNHPNIVKFYNAFENDGHMCMVLELCKYHTIRDFHNIHKIVSVSVCRYFIHQILNGVKYLHEHQIIHRDLKLKNVFLTEQLGVKIGDFGLAARVEYKGERKMGICGTPNFLAPEMLSNKGYSYGVDIWAIGCILYTLLHGNPPFAMKNVKQIYRRIRTGVYQVNKDLPRPVAEMLFSMLHINPERRPTAGQLLNYRFMEKGMLMPKSLLTSCLTMPTYSQLNQPVIQRVQRKVLSIQKVIQPRRIQQNFRQNRSIHRRREHLSQALVAQKGNVISNEQKTAVIKQLAVYVSEWLKTNGISYNFHALQRDQAVMGVLFHQEKYMTLSLPSMQIKSCLLSTNNSKSHHYLFDFPLLRAKFSITKCNNTYTIVIYLRNGQSKSDKVSEFSSSTNLIRGTSAIENMCNEDQSAMYAIMDSTGAVVVQNRFAK